MGGYPLIIVVTLIGFLLLAFILLAPVYRFLQREEEASQQWTDEALARRQQEAPARNGQAAAEPDPTRP